VKGNGRFPVYTAKSRGINLQVWVDQRHSRNQGANLTAFELLGEAALFTVIADNIGCYLMQLVMVDLCIIGSDRTTYTGDDGDKIDA
jgi:methylthioribose-1-phosphate isomerase